MANLGAAGGTSGGANYDISRRFISFDYHSHPSVSDNGGVANDQSLVPEDKSSMSMVGSPHNNLVDLIIEQE
jgi:hypothetical protein